MESGCLRAVCVWHRRAGKDLTHLNWTATRIAQNVGAYWHLYPNALQGRRALWEAMDKEGRKFTHNLPGGDAIGEVGSFCVRKRDDTMQMWFANGSTYQVLGAENVDSLIGAGPIGIIVSELSVYESMDFWDYIRPMLMENGGWVIFNFTPRGENHAHTLFEMAKKNRKWFAEMLTVADTKVVSEEQIQEARDEGMPEERIQQEFYCDFKAPIHGSYYGDLVTLLEEDGHIGKIPYEPALPVYTMWDLGIDDLNCIWWMQIYRKELRLINFEWGSAKGLDHYSRIVNEWGVRNNATYERHFLPWDINVREYTTAKTRLKVLHELVGYNVRVTAKTSIKDGIAAVRAVMRRMYIDEENCADGINGLKQYRRKRDKDKENPDGTPLFLDEPVHDWASNPADALRTGVAGMNADILAGGRRTPPPKPAVAVV